MALCFMVSSVDHVQEFMLCYVNCGKQLSSAPLAIVSQLQLVYSTVHHGVIYFRATRISVCHLCEIRI
jgi:hypothetical protein